MHAFGTTAEQKSGHAYEQCRERKVGSRRKNEKEFRHARAASGGLLNGDAFIFQGLL